MASISPREPVGTCERCGQVHVTRFGHAACTGHVKLEDGSVRACTQPPRRGGTVCGHHGGAAPQVVAANARKLAQLEAEGEVGELYAACRLDVEGLSETEAMRQALVLSATWIRVLQAKLERLPGQSSAEVVVEGDGEGGQRRVVVSRPGLVGPNHQGDLTVHPLMDWLHRWTALHGKLQKAASDMGIDERRQLLNEQQGAEMTQVFQLVAAAIGWRLEDATLQLEVRKAIDVVEGRAS